MGLDNPIHLAFLLTILLLVFGAKRLPEMGRSLGSGLRGFKEAINGEQATEQQPAVNADTASPAAAPIAVVADRDPVTPGRLTSWATTSGSAGSGPCISPTATARARSSSARLSYDRGGCGEPLVLLHPLGVDRRIWDPVVGLLRPHREVLCVDLPGFGDSPQLDASSIPHPRRLASVVIEWLAELGLDGGRAHLAGNSLGGWVALEAAAAGHAASVTAIAPAGLWPRPLPPKPQIARGLARLASPVVARATRSPALRAVALAGIVAHPGRVPAADAAALVRGYANAPGFTAVDRAMRARTFTALAEIKVPFTLVWPEHDRLLARPARSPAGVRELELPGCGHIPTWDDPEAVARVLLGGSG